MTNTDNLTIGQAEIYFREGIDSPLVGYWSFDEGSGTTAIDRSGNGNDGTLYGSPTWTTGISGTCLDFDGIDDYVELGDNFPEVTVTGTYSISLWFKCPEGSFGTSTYNGTLINISPGQASADRNGIVIDNDNLECCYYNETEYVGKTRSLTDSDDAIWNHVVMVNTSGTVTAYLNGSEMSSTGGSHLNQQNQIGHNLSAYFTGSIDEVRIYNRALSTTEIQALYSNPNGKLISASMPDTQSLGNIVTSGINVDTTYAEHYKKVKGKRVKDEEFVITNGININFTFDEIKRENIQKFLLGEEADTSASRIKVMLKNGIRGRAILKFNTDVGNSLLYAIPKCVLKSDGGLNLTSDKWIEGNFKIDVLYHDTYRIGDDTSASKAPFGYVDVDATIFGSPF